MSVNHDLDEETSTSRARENLFCKVKTVDLTESGSDIFDTASEHLHSPRFLDSGDKKSARSNGKLAWRTARADDARRSLNYLNIFELEDPCSEFFAETDADAQPLRRLTTQYETKPIKTRNLPFPARPRAVLVESSSGFSMSTEQNAKIGKGSTYGCQTSKRPIVPDVAEQKLMQDEEKRTAFLSGTCSWTGHGLEDDLSEHVIRNGMQEKAAVHNEFGSARSTFWPHLKSKTGLQSLTFFFTSALHRRGEHGRVQIASTFRPPPRITLGDTKREAWLLDLATENVPLRRLCRTIPHGIQGRQLIQECAARNVPIQRATWFARCVGANELRSFRRKGVTEATLVDNESRWVIEWTSAVEHFVVESTSAEDSGDGLAAATYACSLRLSSRFYKEGLLDKEHFLSWAIRQLQTCSLSRLPFFIVLLRIGWEDVVSSLDRGRCLATAISRRLKEFPRTFVSPIFISIERHLTQIRDYLALHTSQCVPQSWLREGEMFLVMDNSGEEERIGIVDPSASTKRTFYHTSVLSLASRTALPPELSLRTALEARENGEPLAELSTLCRKWIPEATRLVQFILQWASSTFSTILPRIYLAIKLLTHWNGQGVRTDEAILTALPSIRRSNTFQPEYLDKIISELIKSGHFDCGKYMRRIIAIGELNRRDSESSGEIQLLLHIPVGKIPTGLHGLRRMLLRGFQAEVHDQGRKTSTFKALLFEHMLCLTSKGPILRLLFEEQLISSLTRSLFDCVSVWFRDLALSFLNATLEPSEIGPSSSHQERHIELFLFISRTFEHFEDYFSLAIVIQNSVSNYHLDLLVAALYIVELNEGTFAIMGVTQKLCVAAIDRYRALRKTDPPSKDLINLIDRLSLKFKLGRQHRDFLKSELILCENGLGVAAYTPGSDELNEIKVTPYSTNSFDDLYPPSHTSESCLKAGLKSIFQRITKRNEDDCTFAKSLGLCLRRWRNSNEKIFNETFLVSIRNALHDMDIISIQVLFLGAFDSDCLGANELVDMLERHLIYHKSRNMAHVGKVISITITMLLVPLCSSTPSSETIFYKFRLRQRSYHSANPTSILRLLVLCACDPELVALQFKMHIRELASNQRMLSSLQDLMMRQSSELLSVIRSINFRSAVDAIGSISEILKVVIDPKNRLISSFSNSPQLDNPLSSLVRLDTMFEVVVDLFELVDIMSVPFFRLGLQILFTSLYQFHEERDSLMDTIITSAESSISRGCSLWTQLVFGLDINILVNLRHRCERKLLSNYLMLPLQQFIMKENIEQVGRLVSAIETTAFSVPEIGCSSIANMIVECFASYLQSTDEQQHLSQSIAPERISDSITYHMCGWHDRIKALLRISIIHAQSFQANQSSPLEGLLLSLCHLLVSRTLFIETETFQFVLDVAALFVTKAANTTRESVVTKLPLDAISNTQLRFLFGLTQPHNEKWLRVASHSQRGAYFQSQLNSASLIGDMSGDATLPNAFSDLYSLSTRKETVLSDKEASQRLVNQNSTGVDLVPTMSTFPMRGWEMLSDSTLNIGANDTAISLRLFETSKT